jgi:hypothetical protein
LREDDPADGGEDDDEEEDEEEEAPPAGRIGLVSKCTHILRERASGGSHPCILEVRSGERDVGSDPVRDCQLLGPQRI